MKTTKPKTSSIKASHMVYLLFETLLWVLFGAFVAYAVFYIPTIYGLEGW